MKAATAKRKENDEGQNAQPGAASRKNAMKTKTLIKIGRTIEKIKNDTLTNAIVISQEEAKQMMQLHDALVAVAEAAEANNRKPTSEHFMAVCRALAALSAVREGKVVAS